MIRAVYENGTIQPTEPIPPEWVDGQELEIVEGSPSSKNGQDDVEARFREAERLAAGFDDEEWEQLEANLREADRIEKERMRREMGLS